MELLVRSDLNRQHDWSNSSLENAKHMGKNSGQPELL